MPTAVPLGAQEAILAEIQQLQADLWAARKAYQAELRTIAADGSLDAVGRELLASDAKRVFEAQVGEEGALTARIAALRGPAAALTAPLQSPLSAAEASRNLHLSGRIFREASRLVADVTAAEALLQRPAPLAIARKVR